MQRLNDIPAKRCPRPGADGEAGFGALRTPSGCLPLLAMDVQAQITGLHAHVSVAQTFRNTLDVPLEATYIFPLPDRAAATSFRLRVADRVVEGQLKERGQARADYQQAIEAGHRAAIAEEERSGTFSLRVGNIPPHESVRVELTLVGPLPVAEGEAEFRFPLVVAPRYIPGCPLDGPSVGDGWASDTDQVPDASRVTPPVLLPGFKNPVRLTLDVELDPAGLAEDVEAFRSGLQSSLHSVLVEAGPPCRIELRPGERLNRDFILRFPAAARAMRTTLAAAPCGEEPGTFALTLCPPAVTSVAAKPRDVVVVLDRSGSMGGWKMVAARRAVGRLVDTMLEQDRFAVLAFDHAIEAPPHARRKLAEGTDRARWRTLEWLGGIDARGGTELGPALREAARLLAPGDDGREKVLILVTDGQVGGEDAVIRALGKAAGDGGLRIHTLGIDRAVNAGLLRRLADLGGGICDLVESEDRLDAAMDNIHRATGAPAATQLRIEPLEGAPIAGSLAPARLPDVYPDRPLTIFGRFEGSAETLRFRVHGIDAAGQAWSREVSAHPAPARPLHSLWGRAKVRELEDEYAAGSARDPGKLSRQIVEISLAAGVLSRFTAYVAVDTAEVVNPGGRQQQIVQPVESPEGWGEAYSLVRCDSFLSEYDTVLDFQECASRAPLRRMRVKYRGAGDKEFRERTVPPTIEEVVAEIRPLTDVSAKRQGRRRRKNLERLAALLQELATLLAGAAGIAAQIVQTVKDLADEARELLDASRRGDQQALSADRVNALLAQIRETLDELDAQGGGGPTPSPRRSSAAPREGFWK